MAARRCRACDSNYTVDTHRCPICGDALTYLPSGTADEIDTGVFTMTADRVEAWRLEQLIEAGYTITVAERLAVRPWHEVDLHLAVGLLARGCSVELAADILL